MTILLMTNSMQIRVKDNKMLTEIVRMVDGTSLRWQVLSDIFVVIAGKEDLLYELLMELTGRFFCRIEIC